MKPSSVCCPSRPGGCRLCLSQVFDVEHGMDWLRGTPPRLLSSSSVFSSSARPPLPDPHSSSCLSPLAQADDRFRKNVQGSPQAAPPKQPPVPPRSEPFSNGNSEAMHRPMEPQVTRAALKCLSIVSVCLILLFPSLITMPLLPRLVFPLSISADLVN